MWKREKGDAVKDDKNDIQEDNLAVSELIN